MGRTFAIFVLFYFVFEGKFQVQASPGGGGAYLRRDDLTEGFLRYDFGGGGLIFGGAYTWTGLFSEFYGILSWYMTFLFEIPESVNM